MKAKKILFLIAGILRVVAAGIAMLFSLIAFLTKGIMKTVFESSFDMIESIIKEAGGSGNSAELLEYSKAELIDYFLNIITIFFVIVFIVAIVWLIYGIINIRLGSNNRFRSLTKKQGILLCVLGWIFAFELFTNIMITIAVCIKNKDNNEPLYTQANSNTIEVK